VDLIARILRVGRRGKLGGWSITGWPTTLQPSHSRMRRFHGVWRTASEKGRIVELTLQPGMSVARVAQAEGVNSHQVFQCRRAYRQGTLGDAASGCAALLPVLVSGNNPAKLDGVHVAPVIE
jgi:transposase